MFKNKKIALSALAVLLVAIPGCGGSNGSSRSSTIGRQALNVVHESQQTGGRKYTLGPQYQLKLDELISQEVETLGGGKESVPLEINRQVLVNINYFLNDARGFMSRSLTRGSKYIPMMQAILRQKGLPEDLVYLALVESGFRTEAVSHASAVGPWQFIAATGRRYGLTINEWVDERMDPVKSTYAAADYLTTLHDMFGSWPLALAAYNSGEGKILRGMKRHGVTNFWDMTNVSDHLANETKLYVPSFLAAAIIAKDPAAYGIEYERLAADDWDEVVVPNPIDLETAANLCGTTGQRLKELNPHLKKNTTPLNETDFVLRVPGGSQDQFTKAYAKLNPGEMRSGKPAYAGGVRTHVVKKGETAASVAANYGLDADFLLGYNNLTPKRFKAGLKLELPPATAGGTDALASLTNYTIKSGDTKTGIASMFDQSWPEIAALNNLDKNYKLAAGKTIKVRPLSVKKTARVEIKPQEIKPQAAIKQPDEVAAPVETVETAAKSIGVAPEAPAKPRVVSSKSSKGATIETITHKVKAGDTLGSIAHLYGVPVEKIKVQNGLQSSTVIKGQLLKIQSDLPLTAAERKGRSPLMVVETTEKEMKALAGATAVYTVAKGDTLQSIANKNGLSAKELSSLNGLRSTNIKIGQKLRVPAPEKAASKGGRSSALSHTVASGETLGGIAQKYNLTVKELSDLNQLKGNQIRPGQKLKLSGAAAVSSSASASPSETPAVAPTKSDRSSASSHTVASGETLGGIAQKYSLTVKELSDLNQLKGNQIRPGQTLKLGGAAAASSSASASSSSTFPRSSEAPAAAPTAKSARSSASNHTVASGETLGGIAQKYGLTVKELSDLNQLKGNQIRPGQTLKLGGAATASSSASASSSSTSPRSSEVPAVKQPLTASTKPASTGAYVVGDGDTLYSIAKKNNVSVDDLKNLNDLKNDQVRPGQSLKVSGKAATKNPAKPTASGQKSYKVADGDTLYGIAKKNNVSVDALKKANDLQKDQVKPGQTLKLP